MGTAIWLATKGKGEGYRRFQYGIVGVNQTAGMSEYLKIFGIDNIAVFLAYSLDACGEKTYLSLLGKTIDLRSTYKQFGICVADRNRIRLVTSKSSSTELILLMLNLLPFGTIGSVVAFLCISMFLWYMGMVGLKSA